MEITPIKQKRYLLDECFFKYSTPIIKYDGKEIVADIPTEPIKSHIINTAAVVRRIPTDVFSSEVDVTVTSIDDERLAPFVEKHLEECSKDEPIRITDEHQMDIVRDAIMVRLKHWLDTKELDPLLDAEEEIAVAKDTALSLAPTNPDKACRFMLFAAFMFEDETMIINEAENSLKSYLIDSSYIILKELDFTGVFDK